MPQLTSTSGDLPNIRIGLEADLLTRQPRFCKNRLVDKMKTSIALLAIVAAVGHAEISWKAGSAKADVTPKESIWLSGYGNRTKPSEGVLAPIYVKAVAFQDSAGTTSVLLTSDLQGFDVDMIEEIATAAKTKFNLPRERLVLNYSHNHSAPVTGKVLHLYYDLNAEQTATVNSYTNFLVKQIVDVVGNAIHNLAPSQLSFEQGLAGIAVNRRRARPGGRSLPGPVDQDVPVLAVRALNGDLRAIVFG